MRKVKLMLVVTGMFLLAELAFGASPEYETTDLGVLSDIEKSQAQLDWQISYSGEVGPEDYIPHAMLVDKKGNIYLSGLYYILTYNPPYDSMTSFPSLIKLDSDGNELWQIKYEDEDVYTRVTFVDTDDKCNTYVALFNHDTGETRIIKYDKVGNFIWENTFIEKDLNSGSPDIQVLPYQGFRPYPKVPPQIQIDEKGNIYLTRSAVINNTTIRYTFTKVGPAGDIQWLRNQDLPLKFIFPHIPFPVNASLATLEVIQEGNVVPKKEVLLWPRALPRLEVDKWGNVVTAYSNESEIVLTKYDKNGNLLWTDSFEEEDYDFSLYDIAIANSGNIWLSVTKNLNHILTIRCLLGPVRQNIPINSLIINYEPEGQLAFIVDQNMPPGARLMIDKSDNIYLAGTTMSLFWIGAGNTVQKLDARGNLQWSYSGPAVFPIAANYCLDEQTGSLYTVFNHFSGSNVLQKINSNGQLCYEKEFQGPGCSSGKLSARLPLTRLPLISLIKDKKKSIYILETHGLVGFPYNSIQSAYSLSKFTERKCPVKVKGKQK